MKAKNFLRNSRRLLAVVAFGWLILGQSAHGWPHGHSSRYSPWGYTGGGYEPGGYYAGAYGSRFIGCRPYNSYGGYAGYGYGYHGFYSPWSYYRNELPPSYSYEGRIYPFPTPSSQTTPPTVHIFTLPDYGDDPEGWERSSGWNRLAEGDVARAAETFAAGERQFPGSGWPKIGAGLIAARNGDYNKAVYNFKRGFRFDAKGPGEFPDDPELMALARQVAEHYRSVAARSKKDPDAHFMLAASYYLLGEVDAGQEAVAKAMAQGDDSRSARNLKNLLDRLESLRVAQSLP